MEEATRIIEARLFSESRSPPRKLTPSAVREKRRKTTVGLISDILSASSLRQTQQTRYLPSRPSSQGREQSSARQDTQGVDEDMLAGLGDLSALSTLTLNVEQISDASNIGRLGAVNIRSLFLNVNCLKSLESIKDLTKVERLSVKDNKLASLDGLKPLQVRRKERSEEGGRRKEEGGRRKTKRRVAVLEQPKEAPLCSHRMCGPPLFTRCVRSALFAALLHYLHSNPRFARAVAGGTPA